MRCLRVMLLLTGFAPAAVAQTPSERGAILIMRGSDTLVSDRFIRVADTLQGVVQVRAQPRIEYVALLSPGNVVRSLLMGIARTGAPADEPPAQRLRATVVGDTVFADTPDGLLRVPSKAGVIPMFANALALTELLTREATTRGDSADIPYFAMLGSVTLNVAVRRGKADTLVLETLQQKEQLQVDSSGRILGGTIGGTKLLVRRGGPSLAADLRLTLRDTLLSKPDESPPKRPPTLSRQGWCACATPTPSVVVTPAR